MSLTITLNRIKQGRITTTYAADASEKQHPLHRQLSIDNAVMVEQGLATVDDKDGFVPKRRLTITIE